MAPLAEQAHRVGCGVAKAALLPPPSQVSFSPHKGSLSHDWENGLSWGNVPSVSQRMQHRPVCFPSQEEGEGHRVLQGYWTFRTQARQW